MNKSSLEAAAEAAARVNAILIAKGKLKLPLSQLKPKISSSGRNLSGDLITAEIDINDAPLSARNMLTRGHMQDEICKYSGAAISTRGRYMTLEERQNISTPECRPLYLHIQATSPEAVNYAVKEIQEVINQHVKAAGGIKSSTVGVVTYPTSNVNGASNPMLSVTAQAIPTGPHFVQDKVFVGLENAPSNYPVREKILGPSGSFLQHIRVETGANVTLRGKGSGYIEPTSGREAFEPLYIHVTHPKIEGLQAAKALAINLVETAHVEFAQWQQQQQIAQRSVLQSIVIPQATSIAFQNQATALHQSVSHLVQAPITVPPVSVVTSIPVSVQGIPSQAVISYPSPYIANSSISRAQSAVNNLVGVMSTLPVTSKYSGPIAPHTFVSSQAGPLPLAQFSAPVQTLALPQSIAYVPTSQTHLEPTVASAAVQPVIMAPQYSTVAPAPPYVSNAMAPMAALNPVVPMSVMPVANTSYPNLNYAQAALDSSQKKYYVTTSSNIMTSLNSLQESNSNHSTEIGKPPDSSSLVQPNRPGSQDRDLMPPPLPPFPKNSSSNRRFSTPSEFIELKEPERKRLKGALLRLASMYGSDDSSDEECPSPNSDSSSTSYASFHSNKPLM